MEYVALSQLADMLGIDRSHARRYAIRHGFRFRKARDLRSGQLVNVLTREEAEALVAIRRREGFIVQADATCHTTLPPSQRIVPGWLCIIQLVPDLDPGRLWIGFAVDPEAKLAVCRPLAPTAQIVKAWPCRPSWEPAAVDALAGAGCRPLGDHLFACDDLEAVVQRGETFFALMPNVTPPVPHVETHTHTHSNSVCSHVV